MIHFRIRDMTLCGADYIEPSAKAAKDGRLCNDCIQVMWQEQYRRDILGRVKIEDAQQEQELGHLRDDSHSTPLYLSTYEKET
jgi:hypothetical protein